MDNENNTESELYVSCFNHKKSRDPVQIVISVIDILKCSLRNI